MSTPSPHSCNVCGHDQFEDFHGRKGVMCSSCNSLVRTRLLWSAIERRVHPRAQILHFAPERGIHTRISGLVPPDGYHTADLNPSRYPWVENMAKIDLTSLEHLPSDHYDLILHSHVLEHVPCNEAYVLFHLHRALKSDGRHVFVIPIVAGNYECSFAEMSAEERTERFGQHDHLRRYGKDDFGDHLGKIVHLPPAFDARSLMSEEDLTRHKIPRGYWEGWSVNSPIDLAKNDMLFMS